MGQKCNPIGNRLGIIRGWESNWYGGRDMAEKVIQDEKIRIYLQARIEKGGVAHMVIERTLKRVTVTIQTSRPGIIIGKGGQEVDRIREELKKLTKMDVQINIMEIRKPELDANIVAESIAKQIEARINYRRAIKMAIQSTMRSGAEGIKVRISGRLNGAEMARSEEYKDGRTPLHTFRADIDYSIKEAQTVFGKIGIKCWICKGEVYGKRELTLNAGGEQGTRNRRGGNERGAGYGRNEGGGDFRERGGRGGAPGDRAAGGGRNERGAGGGGGGRDRGRSGGPGGGRPGGGSRPGGGNRPGGGAGGGGSRKPK
ncbi:MAG: 30S ribosomal protein S3 [Saprospiraceae bacterium]|uniref:Small ribosomal subunit protein uS3 n=1 Tax=Candidatus Opimibacter skivensis TaxID=2982028 RepID=A0A9D7SWG1_9BACT|nr:30S ribosomal protein S3 [Candidatus Opimibacter skivensis]